MPKLTFLQKAFLSVYSGAWTLATPFLKRHKRLKDNFSLRKVPDNWAQEADIWLQAASGGEAYLLWEIVKHLPKEDEQQIRLLATSMTEQGLAVLKTMQQHLAYERPDLHIQVAFFPFDSLPLMQKALNKVRPRIVALLETELWPSLLSLCKERGVKICMLNARISKKSLRNYRLLDKFLGNIWSRLLPRHIMAISQADAKRFEVLLHKKSPALHDRPLIEITPNIKFDRAQHLGRAKKNLADNPLYPLFASIDKKRPIVLFASVREEEEAALFSCIESLHKSCPQSLLIVAPRHMHRVQAWQDFIQKNDTPFCPQSATLRSGLSAERPIKDEALLIWDTFGELQDLFAFSQLVFVGGSLAKLGGQNILEPLAFGCVPYTGRHLHHFLWALDLESDESLEAAGLVKFCDEASGLYASLCKDIEAMLKAFEGQEAKGNSPQNLDKSQYKGQIESKEDVQARFRKWLALRLGGTKANADLLYALLRDE